MNGRILLIALVLALIIFPVTVNVVSTHVLPSLGFILPNFPIDLDKWILIVGGGGDEMDGEVHPG
jgi:hypothetical protein